MPLPSPLSSNNVSAAIAVTRFGLGARPGELARIGGDPRGWLLDQIRPAGADQPQTDGESSAVRIQAFRAYQTDRREMRRAEAGDNADSAERPDRDPVQIAARMLREGTAVDFLARARLAATTPAGFRERWALFWANHFTVSAVKLITATVAGPFEQEAIRPRVFGRFEDLLIASTAHPAMLLYLDQAQSVGPGSRAAGLTARRRQAGGAGSGLNENLAREILELHTVGVDGGYSQADVTSFARALTGWSVGGLREAEDRQGRFVFRVAAHEPGPRTVMGRTYREGEASQATAILKDLAAHPATARHLARKIARHFVADDPPPALVSRLEAAWKASEGDLSTVARALVEAPEAWDPTPAKFKTPYEFLTSSWRAIGGQPGAIEHLGPPLNALGQRPFSAPSPKGWDETAATWAAPDAVIKRMTWAQGFSAVVAGELDPNTVASEALGSRLSDPVRKAVARAESREEALSILLMSPEFQRR